MVNKELKVKLNRCGAMPMKPHSNKNRDTVER